MEQIELSASLIIERAWNYAKSSNGLVMFAINVAVSVIIGSIFSFSMRSMVAGGVAFTNPEDVLNFYAKLFSNPVLILSYLVSIIVGLGMLRCAILLVQGKIESLSFNMFVLPIMSYLKIFAVAIICLIAVYAGLAMCIAPGVFLLVRLFWAPIYLMDNHEASIGEAFSASWNMSSGDFWQLLGIGVLSYFVYLAGFIACCVGMYFTMIIYLFSIALTYVELTKKLQ
jgi:hypothetical protein